MMCREQGERNLIRGFLAHLLTRQMQFAVHQEDLGTVGNNFIATAPGHPVLVLALRD